MNLFSKPKAQTAATPPSIDEAQQRVEAQRRGRGMRGRASTMLTDGRGLSAGPRQTTGN